MIAFDTFRTPMTVTEGARRLGVSRHWYQQQLRERLLPGRKMGRTWRLTEDDVQAALDQHFMPAIVKAPNPWGMSRRSALRLSRPKALGGSR